MSESCLYGPNLWHPILRCMHIDGNGGDGKVMDRAMKNSTHSVGLTLDIIASNLTIF